MKRWIRPGGLIIFLTIFLVSCNRQTTETPQIPMLTEPAQTAAPSMGVSLDTFADMAVVSPQTRQTIQLSGGSYVGGDVDGGILAAGLLPQAAFGDLNGDGMDDAALLLSENMGESGVFVSLIVMLNSGDGFSQAGSEKVDDRPLINSVSIENGRIVLDAVIHAVDDSMAEPTMKVIEEYAVDNDQLVLRRFDSTIYEAVRMIVIDAPVEGQEVSGSVQVTGSMPIAAFENSLLYHIYDEAGEVIASGPFMVTAADMGAPATFDNPLVIPGAAVGERYRIELEETSMADGSTLCLNSVEVVVK